MKKSVMAWSIKYKRSINCKKPKGFSQKQYCDRQARGGRRLSALGQTPRQAAYAKTRERLATESEGTTAEIDQDLKAGRCVVAAQKIHELTLATGKRCGMLQSCATPIVNKLKKQSAKVVDCVNLQPWSD